MNLFLISVLIVVVAIKTFELKYLLVDLEENETGNKID